MRKQFRRITDFVTLLSFFAAGFCILIGVGHLALAKAGKKKYYWSIAYFTTGALMFYGFLFVGNQLKDYPFFYGPHIALSFLPGYFYYAYFRNWLNPQARENHWLFLLPFFLVLLVTMPFIMSSMEEKRNAVLAYYRDHIFSWREGLFIAGFVYDALFPVLIVRTLIRAYDAIQSAARSILLLVYICALLSLTSFALIIFGHIIANFLLIKIAGGGFLIAACVGYLFMQRSAHMTAQLREVEKTRYARTRLSGVDIENIERQLDDLMQREKLFVNYELTMSIVAQRLGIKTQQLSEFINLHLHTSFRDYLNRHRIEEAKRLLSDAAVENILQVAFQAGFGSKSSFNELFRKATGKTPSEFHQHSQGR